MNDTRMPLLVRRAAFRAGALGLSGALGWLLAPLVSERAGSYRAGFQSVAGVHAPREQATEARISKWTSAEWEGALAELESLDPKSARQRCGELARRLVRENRAEVVRRFAAFPVGMREKLGAALLAALGFGEKGDVAGLRVCHQHMPEPKPPGFRDAILRALARQPEGSPAYAELLAMLPEGERGNQSLLTGALARARCSDLSFDEMRRLLAGSDGSPRLNPVEYAAVLGLMIDGFPERLAECAEMADKRSFFDALAPAMQGLAYAHTDSVKRFLGTALGKQWLKEKAGDPEVIMAVDRSPWLASALVDHLDAAAMPSGRLKLITAGLTRTGDLDSIDRLAARLEKPAMREAFEADVLGQLATHNIASAKEYLARLLAGKSEGEKALSPALAGPVQRLVDHLADEGPKSAMDFIRTLPVEAQPALLEQALVRASRQGGEFFLEGARKAASAVSPEGLAKMAENLAWRGEAFPQELVDGLPPNSRTLVALGNAAATSDPRSRATSVFEIARMAEPDPSLTPVVSQAIGRTLAAWAESDPVAAADFHLTNRGGTSPDFQVIAEKWGQIDPVGLSGWMAQHLGDLPLDRSIEVLVRSIRDDSDAAVRWAGHIQDAELRQKMMGELEARAKAKTEGRAGNSR